MWARVGGLRKARALFWIGFGLLLLIGSVVALSKLDHERYRCDPARMERLARTEFPPLEPGGAPRDDWPQWRGRDRDGVALATGLRTTWPADGPPVVWKKLVGCGFSSVAIAGGRLYTMEEVATRDGPEASPASPRYEAIICCDARSGRELWRFHYPNRYDERFGGGPRSTPAVDGNFVYAVGPTGIFHCLRADTGEKVWRHDLLEEFHGPNLQYGVSFSPLIEGDLVYATPGGPNGNAIVAFEKRSGRLVWKALDDAMGYSSPIAVTIAGVRQVLFLTNEALVSLAPQTGTLYWRYPWKTEGGNNIATPVAFGPYIFISSAYDKGCALLEVTAEADGTLRADRVYEHNRMRNYFASSVRWGEHLYGFDMTDLVCMDLRTGAIAWREKGFRSFRKGTLLIADGHLVILGEQGTLALAVAAPAGYREEASHQVSEHKCWTVPALAGGKLYVRDECQLVCLDLGNAPGR
jgi:outer membrane protein assembly factor BamB